MTLQDLLNVTAMDQTIRIKNHATTIYTGDLEEWEDAETFKDWDVIRVYVGVFGTLTINIEK